MFKKQFVSLVFSSKKLQVLQMDLGRRKVEKFGSVDLEAGLVVNYRVQKIEALSEVVKNTWAKLKISEKSVGIVIPEFSTYTKSLSLPKLEFGEIDEAVRWQSQDFLPGSGKDMIMDWQLIGESAMNYTILVVAIKKDILANYVDVASRAGLIPLVVETPSLSLTRLADGEGTGKLVIYVAGEETVIVLSEGETIIASSVANSSSQNEILMTAERIMKHYGMVEVKKVVVGGVGLAKDFYGALQAQLKRPVEVVRVKVNGMDVNQIQEYLIAISLQLKDPAQPEDERTINLLPPMWVEHYKGKLMDIQLWSLTLVASIFVWVCLLASVIAYLLMGGQIQEMQRLVIGGQEDGADEIFKQVEAINALSENVIEITEKSKNPQEVLNTATALKPAGVVINKYEIDFEGGIMKLSGRAAERGALLSFKQALADSQSFNEVNLPVTSLVGEYDLDFTITIILKQVKEKEVPKLKI